MATQKHEVKKPNRKLDLKNDILSWLGSNKLGWTADEADEQGHNFVNTLADVLWAIDGHEKTLQDRGCGVPDMMNHLKGYNKLELTKHKKQGHNNLGYVDVLGHSLRYVVAATLKGMHGKVCSFSYSIINFNTYSLYKVQ